MKSIKINQLLKNIDIIFCQAIKSKLDKILPNPIEEVFVTKHLGKEITISSKDLDLTIKVASRKKKTKARREALSNFFIALYNLKIDGNVSKKGNKSHVEKSENDEEKNNSKKDNNEINDFGLEEDEKNIISNQQELNNLLLKCKNEIKKYLMNVKTQIDLLDKNDCFLLKEKLDEILPNKIEILKISKKICYALSCDLRLEGESHCIAKDKSDYQSLKKLIAKIFNTASVNLKAFNRKIIVKRKNIRVLLCNSLDYKKAIDDKKLKIVEKVLNIWKAKYNCSPINNGDVNFFEELKKIGLKVIINRNNVSSNSISPVKSEMIIYGFGFKAIILESTSLTNMYMIFSDLLLRECYNIKKSVE